METARELTKKSLCFFRHITFEVRLSASGQSVRSTFRCDHAASHVFSQSKGSPCRARRHVSDALCRHFLPILRRNRDRQCGRQCDTCSKSGRTTNRRGTPALASQSRTQAVGPLLPHPQRGLLRLPEQLRHPFARFLCRESLVCAQPGRNPRLTQTAG
jgi:hypothetical protein